MISDPCADVKEADSIAALFEQISSCEGVLGKMATMLQSFQDNLVSVKVLC